VRNQRKIGVILSYVSQFVHIISGILYTPIMLRLLGQNEYGLYQLVYSVVSYLSLLSLGFSSSYMKFYAQIKKEQNEERLESFNGMFLSIFLVIGIICLICGNVMVINIKNIFGNGLSSQEYETAKFLMFLMVINLAMTFPCSVFDSIMAANEQFFFQKLIVVLQNLLNPFITLPLLILGYGSVAMVMVTTGLTVAKMMVSIWYCVKKLHARFAFRNFDFRLLKTMWLFTSLIFINMIVDQINWSVDKFLLGRLTGTAIVAVYGVGAQINTLYLELSISVSNVFIPRVNHIVVNSNSDRELTLLFTKVGRIQFMILSFILSGFILFGKFFIHLWAGEGYEQSYYVSIALMLPVTVPLIQNIGIEIQRAKNMHKARSIVYFFIAIGNIFLSIPFILKLGALGAALGTSISLIIGNVIFMNWYYDAKIHLDIIYFWKQIIRIIPSFMIPIIISIVLSYMFPIHNLRLWIIQGVIYVILFVSFLWIWGMNEDERNIIRNLLKK
jgi:O-antigen/teichoic acid export membrane protein